MTPGHSPGGTHAVEAGGSIDTLSGEAPTPPHREDDASSASTGGAAAFPNAVDRALSIRKVGNTVAVTLGDYAPDSLAFLFAWDPAADKEVYVRSGRRSELEEQASANNREGRDYFVLPRNPSETQTLFARVDDGAPYAASSSFGHPVAAPDPSAAGASQPPGGPEHMMDVFVVVPRTRRPHQPFRVEKNLDGRHWTSKAEAEGALAVFEHQHADIAGAMSVRSARLRFS